MPFIVIDRERYALPIGDSVLGGAGPDALPIPALAAAPAVALLQVAADGTATIQRVGSGAASLNGVAIESIPMRLLHGGRLEVHGIPVLFGDIGAAGRTMHMEGVTVEELALLADLRPSEPTATSGGRLIAEGNDAVIMIPADGIDIGRDPGCGIVLSAKDVSRRHARVESGLMGYVVTDLSTNGVHVNGARVEGSRLLGNGDVIAVGSDRFRFEAEAASFDPQVTRVMPVSAGTRVLPSAPAVRQPVPVLLATLEILNEGVLKGTRFRIEQPVMSIGRAAHNEIRLTDDSVSSAHAILTRRGTSWTIADPGSTNGTYIDGVRIAGERPIDGVSEVRLGNIKMLFRPIGGTGRTEPSGESLDPTAQQVRTKR